MTEKILFISNKNNFPILNHSESDRSYGVRNNTAREDDYGEAIRELRRQCPVGSNDIGRCSLKELRGKPTTDHRGEDRRFPIETLECSTTPTGETQLKKWQLKADI